MQFVARRLVVLLVCCAALVALAVAAATVSAAGASAGAGALVLDEKAIRCKVCERAIDHVWHQGVDLRAHCRQEDAHDPRCEYSSVNHFGIEEMVTEVCQKLPKTHRLKDGADASFDLEPHHEDPKHDTAVAAAIRNACIKWVHEEHGLDQVALYVFANLDAGKSTATILGGLRDRYCKNACNADYVQSHNVQNPDAADAKYSKWKNADL